MFELSKVMEIWIMAGLGVMAILFLMSHDGPAVPQGWPA